MTFKPIESLLTNTQAYTPVDAVQLVLPPSVIAALTAQLAGGFFTTISVNDLVNYEIMFVTGISAGAANVLRGQEGTVPVPLASGALVQFTWTATGIAATAPGGGVTLTGSGGSTVTGGPAYNVASPIWTFTPGPGIGITGGPYAFTISNTSLAATPVTVTASGIAVATGGPVNYNVNVAAPVFIGAGGITISGVWPNITITNTSSASGTMTNLVAGAGIAITGATPTINPTVSLATVGPGAGTYGGIQLNAYGQVVAFTGSLITSVTTTTSGLSIGGPVSGALTINVASASTSGQGLVKLAPNTAIGSRDSANTTMAVTPSGLDAVLDVIELTVLPATLNAYGNQNALSPSVYTNTISGLSVIPVAVTGSKNAIVDVYVESYDPVNPTVQQSFGIALFDGPTLLAGVSNIFACNVRHLRYYITAPVSSNFSVKTTPLIGTQVIGSYYATVVKN